MSRPERYDVFVSYSHADGDWVTKTLVPFLEFRGFKVCIDARDFVAGALGIDEMQRAVLQSRHIVAVLSKNYVASAWSAFESAMAQSLDPNAAARKIVPVLIDECELPLRLRIIHYRDLRFGDAAVWELLARDLVAAD